MIAVEKADAEESLSAALPALEEARLALSDLEKNDVTEIRLTSYKILFCSVRVTMLFMCMQIICKATNPGADSV